MTSTLPIHVLSFLLLLLVLLCGDVISALDASSASRLQEADWLKNVVTTVKTTKATPPTIPDGPSTSPSPHRFKIPLDVHWKHRMGLHFPPAWDDPPLVNPWAMSDAVEAQPQYDDSNWTTVQIPHDALISAKPSQKACPDGCSGRSYVPRHVMWYRKVLSLPLEDDNDNDHMYSLIFDGSFRNTTVWINGRIAVESHACGYTPFRIDDLLSLSINRQNSNQNVTVAVFVDPSNGDAGGTSHASGWWYEGGGLYRRVWLERVYRPAHVIPDTLFVKSTLHSKESSLHATMEVEATATAVPIEPVSESENNSINTICYHWEVDEPSSSLGTGERVLIIKTDTKMLSHTPNDKKEIAVNDFIPLNKVKLWTPAAPHLYQVSIVVTRCSTTTDNKTQEDELDRVTVPHGLRTLHLDPNKGFFINNLDNNGTLDPRAHFKMRGFCDHDNFAVVGMALPDRLHLFRAQASRAIGGNARRTSHNPPDKILLDIHDRLGILVMDENRLFDNNTQYVENFRQLVLRDRNHPSVVIWSFCNEVGCEGLHEQGGPAFQHVATTLDGTRPTLANMFTFHDLLGDTVDVQGFSHRHRDTLEQCHAQLPHKPIVQSECCSCNTFRGQDVGCETTNDNPHDACPQISFNARCLDLLVNASDGVDYAAGTFVWTLTDYYGEPPKPGLHVSSTYGQFDLCGFVKSSAHWFRMQWLLGVDDARVDKTFPTGSNQFAVHLVEGWESPTAWNQSNATAGNRTIHAYSNAPLVDLFVNRQWQGSRSIQPMVQGDGGSYAEWRDVPWEPGTLKAVARLPKKDAVSPGVVVATDTRHTADPKASKLVLSLDCPSLHTGTGHSLFLDGQDVALVRASVVDDQGELVVVAAAASSLPQPPNITFQILSGPGRIQGTANGDPSSYQPRDVAHQTAYHGLARAVVRVTSRAGLEEWTQRWLDLVDPSDGVDMDLKDDSTYKGTATATDDILMQATAPGFVPSNVLTIPTSIDPADQVLAVAERLAGQPVDFFGGDRNNDLDDSMKQMEEDALLEANWS